MATDMPEPCKTPLLDSCQNRFLWTHRGVDLALHSFFGLVLQVGDAETTVLKKRATYFVKTRQKTNTNTVVCHCVGRLSVAQILYAFPATLHSSMSSSVVRCQKLNEQHPRRVVCTYVSFS